MHDNDLVSAIERDYQTAPLSDADRAMLDYVAKLTGAPYTISQSDVDDLRTHGFSESAVLDVCQVASYYAFVNRMASGLGVELET